ncbi:hypothetical protein KSS87_023783 [Heliosperma pusillum]|nr:hypothetical protein KSS87_023783 [Heliosperma pusillum]
MFEKFNRAREEASEETSRSAAVEFFGEICVDYFAPFMRTASEALLKLIPGIDFLGAIELIIQCKDKGLNITVGWNAARIKADRNLSAAGLLIELFSIISAIVSADAFENLMHTADIFISASKILDVPESEIRSLRTSLFVDPLPQTCDV